MFLKSDFTPDPGFNFNLAYEKEVQNTLTDEVEVEVELWWGLWSEIFFSKIYDEYFFK